MTPPLLMVRQPRWWSGRSGSARTLGVAAVAALVVSICFIGGSRLTVTGTQLGGGAALDSDSGRSMAAGAHHPGDQVATTTTDEMQELLVYMVGRRLLSSSGPGSHPPRCTSKCGSCNPCYPVHVSVPPGVLVTTEYYPEAWRCKCRNQLYMP